MNMKKILAFVLTLVMVTSLFGGFSAFAAEGNSDIGIRVEKTSDGVDMIVAAKGTAEFSSVEAVFSYDSSAFEYDGYGDSGFPTVIVNESERILVLSTDGDNVTNIITLHFTKKAAFDATKAYEFGFKVNDATDPDYEAFSWVEDQPTFTATYQEATPAKTYTVTFDSDGGSAVAAQNVAENGKASKPANPTKSGYKFDGWQLGDAAYNFSTPVTAAITLTAKWTKISNDAIDLSDIKISKTAIASDGVDVNETFTFKVTPQNGAPSIFKGDEVTIAVNKAGEAFEAAFEATQFPKGGVYKYVVEEVVGSDSDWTYDSTKYYLEIEIEPNDQYDTLALDKKVVIHKDSENGTKVEAMAFQNTYKPASKLVVTKTVSGEGDNPMFKDKEFSFTVKFTKPAVENGGITVKKFDKDGAEITLENAAAVYGTDYSFTLKNGEKVVFDNVAEGTSYKLTETGTEYYTASAEVTSGGVKGAKQDGEYGKDFSVESKTANGDNQVDVTNTYSITPPTGILMHTELWLVIGFAVLAAGGIFFLSRRGRKEND